MLKWAKGFLRGLMLFLLPVIGPVLHPDDHHILRYYAAIMRVVKPTIHQVFILLLPNNGRTVKELLFDIDGYSQTKYKKQFDESERQKLDNNEPSERFDISLLFKLLQLICNLANSNDPRWNETGTLENWLRKMKNERNILAHEDLCFTFDELERKIVYLEDMCRSALVAAGQRSGNPVGVDIENMEQKMKEVLESGIDLWEPYKEALNDLRDKQSNVLARVGRDDLKKLAKKLRILNPFAWLLDTEYSHLDVELIFTKLIIQGKDEINMQELLVTTLPSGDVPDIIIISGPPGIGKSSLVRFMVHDWLSFQPTILGLENVDLLLPVELRHVTSNNVKELVREEMLPSVSQYLQNDDILTTLNNISVVWLLDGFDEASLEVKKVVKELLKKSQNSRILITTRTEFTHEIEKNVNDIHRLSLTVIIKGFSNVDVENYSKKLIDVSVKNTAERDGLLKSFMRFCKEENSLQWEIFTVPLFLSIILTMWLDNSLQLSGIKTMSALYSLLVDHIVNKMIVRESFSNLKQIKSTLQKKINAFLDDLGFILWKDENEFTLLENEVDLLEKKCKDLGIPFQETMSAFFVFSEIATASGTKEQYTITHRTLKEFLSARAFCNYMISKGWDIMKTAGKWIEMTRDTLQYDPRNISLCSKYNLENLDMNKPGDDYINDSRRTLLFNNKVFYGQREEFCPNCFREPEPDDKDSDYYYFPGKTGSDTLRVKRSKKYWYHIRDSLQGRSLTYIIGYLCLKEEMNETRSEQLVFVSHFLSGGLHVDHCFCHSLMKEGASSHFSSKFSEYLQTVLWSFSYAFQDPLCYAKHCLQYAVPNAVHLHCCNRLSICPREFLDKCIQTFKNHRSNIYLDLRILFINERPDLSHVNSCIKELLHEDSEARLVALHSPLDEEGIKLLEEAADLRELSIKVSANNLPAVAEVLGKLPSLQTLRIAIDPASYNNLELPNLNLGSADLLDFVIVLTEIHSLESQVIGETLMKISPYVKHVILTGLADSFTWNRVSHYIHCIMTNLKNVKEIDLMLDISAEDGIFYYISFRDMVPILRDFFPDSIIRVRGFAKDGSTID